MRKDDGAVAAMRWWMPRILRVLTNHMLTVDEPDHARLRGIVDEAFRRRAVLEMEPRVRAIADELAGDLFAQGSPADLVTRYAQQLPLWVMGELLGLPLADRPKFIAWVGRVTDFSSALYLLRVIPTLRGSVQRVRWNALRDNGIDALGAGFSRGNEAVRYAVDGEKENIHSDLAKESRKTSGGSSLRRMHVIAEREQSY